MSVCLVSQHRKFKNGGVKRVLQTSLGVGLSLGGGVVRPCVVSWPLLSSRTSPGFFGLSVSPVSLIKCESGFDPAEKQKKKIVPALKATTATFFFLS